MSDDIKVRYGDVEQAIATVESASEALEYTLLKNVAGGNVLDFVERLNQLNALLEQQVEEYKRILKMNNDAVRTTVQKIKEADEQLSSSIKLQ